MLSKLDVIVTSPVSISVGVTNRLFKQAAFLLRISLFSIETFSPFCSSLLFSL